MRIAREDRSLLAQWWFTVDRTLLIALVLMLVVGFVLSLAASPPLAIRKGLPTFHFVYRHLLFAAVGACLIVGLSFLTPKGVRRLALVVFVAALVAMIAALIDGVEIKGAQRWIHIGGFSLQPSEFAKPAFVVLVAWLFSEAGRRPDMPAVALSGLLLALLAALLLLQPDVGQTMLATAVWGALYLLSGQSMVGVVILGVIAACGLAAAYLLMPHVAARIDQYIQFSPLPSSQTGRSMRSFIEGGFLGRGPGEGTLKSTLPDAHTDFIFAVIAEEHGIVACLALLLVFALITAKAMISATRHGDVFAKHGIQGLALLLAIQTMINMGVNVGLLPAKGMTLPFISSGGSSILGLSIGMGMMLALCRAEGRHAHALRAPQEQVSSADPWWEYSRT